MAVTSQLPTTVGFIGLGAMGKPMANNMAKKLPPGSTIHVHDVAAAAVDEICAAHPQIMSRCSSAKEVAQKSHIVFTMLPEGSHVRSVYLDKTTGIAAGLTPTSQSLLIDCSTIDTATNLDVKAQLAAAFPQTSFYDVPVSGGVIGAVKGTVAFFMGCSEQDANVQLLRPLLQTMGGKVIACGGPSLGLAAKLSNNYLSGVITIATSEAMDMGMRAGLDARVLASVFAAGTAQNTICDVFNPVPGVCPEAPASHGYQGGFRVQLMRKDIGLAVDMARRVGSHNVLGSSGLGIFTGASQADDCRDLDSRVVYRYLGGNEDWEKKG